MDGERHVGASGQRADEDAHALEVAGQRDQLDDRAADALTASLDPNVRVE